MRFIRNHTKTTEMSSPAQKEICGYDPLLADIPETSSANSYCHVKVSSPQTLIRNYTEVNR